jgi:hypothetical protein
MQQSHAYLLGSRKFASHLFGLIFSHPFDEVLVGLPLHMAIGITPESSMADFMPALISRLNDPQMRMWFRKFCEATYLNAQAEEPKKIPLSKIITLVTHATIHPSRGQPLRAICAAISVAWFCANRPRSSPARYLSADA